MKKFQNIAPKVSEHMHGAPPLSGAIAAPNAGHQNLQRGNEPKPLPGRQMTKADQMKIRAQNPHPLPEAKLTSDNLKNLANRKMEMPLRN